MRSTKEVMQSLKRLRKMKGITVEQVVEYLEHELEISVAPKTVYGWESGIAKPNIECFAALCKYYGISNMTLLFDDSEDMTAVDAVLREKLYLGYVSHPNVQNAVDILLDI